MNTVCALTRQSQFSRESPIRLPQSKTLRELVAHWKARQLLDCASALALSEGLQPLGYSMSSPKRCRATLAPAVQGATNAPNVSASAWPSRGQGGRKLS